MASYSINVSIGRDVGCDISDDEFASYLSACEGAIEAAYPDATAEMDEHDGSGTRVGNSRPWSNDDGDINDACNGICQDVWEQCCANGFAAPVEYTADEEAAVDAHELALAVCREHAPRPSREDVDVYVRAVGRLQRLGVDVRYHADGSCVYGKGLADELEDE